MYDDGLVTWEGCTGGGGSVYLYNGESYSVPCHLVGTLSGPFITSNTVSCGTNCD